MNTTEIPAELEKLKAEVAELRQELNDLTQHFGVEKFEGGKKNVNLLCSAITLFSPDNPNQMRGVLCSDANGPTLSLWGKDGKPRVTIQVDQDGIPSIQLFQPNDQLAVVIGQDSLGMPSVGVFHEGLPRAAMKASEKTGIISAVHNGGQARVTIVSQEDAGEILLVNPDMKVAVKLSTQGRQDEGFITVNHSNGKAAVILSALPEHGCVMVNDRAGRVKYSLPDSRNI
jgi:hypothetical protein